MGAFDGSVTILEILTRYGSEYKTDPSYAQAVCDGSVGLYMTWQERLKQHIRSKSLTQDEFARAFGFNRDVLNRYLNGKQQPPAKFFASLRAGGVSLDWLFTGEGSAEADRDPGLSPDLEQLLIHVEELVARLRGSDMSGSESGG